MLRLLTVSLLLVFAALPASAQQTFTPEQKAAIEKLVREVMVNNPEILVEAMQALEAKQQAQASEDARAAIAANQRELLDDGHSYVAGNPKGDVTIVEFFDYRCGYCKQVHPSLQVLLKEDGKIRLVLKELPVLGPESLIASRAAVAAMEQDKGSKYYAFHNAMMGHRGQLTEAEVFRMAGEAGLDVKKLRADMGSAKVEEALRSNHALANKLGIQGTPGFVIGNELVPGAIPLETMRSLVKQARG